MTAFSRATIAIATIYGDQQVQAMVRGGLAVHGSAGHYTVTHIASGKAICHSDQQRTAKGVVVELLDKYPHIGQASPPPQMVESLRYFLQDLSIVKSQKVAQIPIVNSPLELCAIYPDYFTPSEELRALDAEVAAGNFGRISDASAVEWRELIMVRMGTGKQAAILDKDIPPKPRATPLPPHIPPGYAGVKLLTQRMWKLGQAIDEQALQMISFYDRRNGEIQQAAEFEWWLNVDDELSEMIRRGWCDWAICVALFATLPEDEQKKITDVLGFVGSDEQGWVAYGKKTFLRSKRLVELTECRRAVQAALNG